MWQLSTTYQTSAGEVAAHIGGALHSPLLDDDAARLALPWQTPAGQAAFCAEFEPLLGDIRCPVQVIWGSDDPWIPLERGRALAREIGTNLHPLAGPGHLPQLEDPAATTQALLNSVRALCATAPEDS